MHFHFFLPEVKCLFLVNDLVGYCFSWRFIFTFRSGSRIAVQDGAKAWKINLPRTLEVKSVSHTCSSRRLPLSSRPCSRHPSDHVSHFSRHLPADLPSYPSMTIWRPSLHKVHKLSAYYLVRVYQLQWARRSVAVLPPRSATKNSSRHPASNLATRPTTF